MKKLILGIDGGNFEGKVAGPFGAISFKSNIAPYQDLKISETHGDDDMIYEIDGKKGLAGTIAKNESRLGNTSMFGTSKAHRDTKIRILLAIFRYLKKFKLEPETISIVVGQPIDGHDDNEKKIIRDMLEGSHPIVVNDEAMTINIGEVGVAPEGTGAYWSGNQEHPTCFLLDFGSGTINCVSFLELKHINATSKTINYGTETPNLSLEVIADGAIRETTALGWNKNAPVLVCGGSAGVITQLVQEHYTKAEVLIPTLVLDTGKKQILEPKFANAVGFYTIAKGSFK